MAYTRVSGNARTNPCLLALQNEATATPLYFMARLGSAPERVTSDRHVTYNPAKNLHRMHCRREQRRLHVHLHTDKSLRNIIKSTRNRIVFTIFLLI